MASVILHFKQAVWIEGLVNLMQFVFNSSLFLWPSI